MARVLLIAGSSFIGQHCARVFSQAGHEVLGTARRIRAGSSLVSLDITRPGDVDRVIGVLQPDWIVNCAGSPSSPNPAEHYAVHVQGTLNVLQAAADNGHVPVLLMGSAAEYGPVPAEELPVQESHLEEPTTFFGASKLAQTQLACVAARELGLSILITRPFNVIGPGLPDSYFAAALTGRLLRQRDEDRRDAFEVRNAEATRDFVDVRDVARALLMLREATQPERGSAEVFNIATGLQTSLLDVAMQMGDLAGGLNPVAGGEAASRGGISRSCGSFAKLHHATGWQPEIPWRQSIVDLWNSVSAGHASVPRGETTTQHAKVRD